MRGGVVGLGLLNWTVSPRCGRDSMRKSRAKQVPWEVLMEERHKLVVRKDASFLFSVTHCRRPPKPFLAADQCGVELLPLAAVRAAPSEQPPLTRDEAVMGNC